MSLEENKAIIRKATEALNKQDLTSLDEWVSPDYIIHTYKIRDLDEFKQYYTRLYRGFPDWHETIEDIIAEGDKVWVRITFTGTHTGDYRGLAPNGKKHTVVGVNIYRIVDGKIAEVWVVEDTLNSLKQLGVIEFTEKAKNIFPEDAT